MPPHECYQEDRLLQVEGKANKLCEFKGSTESDLKTLFSMVKDIKDNHLKHINSKINALLFTVLGSVFITVLVAAVKWLLSIIK